MVNDIRFALRQLVNQPGFTFIAVVVLALGIGANTAIFSVVNAVLLRPLPYPHSEQLVLLRERLLGPSGFESGSVSYMNYLDWRAAQKSFTDLALARADAVSLSASNGTSPPEAARAGRITANYLSILQVPPLIGRDLVEADDVPGAAKVALISERVWRKQFGGLPIAIGQRLNIDGVPREIIGVVSERVRFPRNCDVFLPLADLRADHDFLSRGNHQAFSCLGRLKAGATLKQAIAELDTIAADLSRRYPDSNTGRQISAKLLLEYSGRSIPISSLCAACSCRLRPVDRVRECSKPSARAWHCAAQGTRCARGAWCKPLGPGAPGIAGKRSCRVDRRHLRRADRRVEP